MLAKLIIRKWRGRLIFFELLFIAYLQGLRNHANNKYNLFLAKIINRELLNTVVEFSSSIRGGW
jgi:hypothetical protein